VIRKLALLLLVAVVLAPACRKGAPSAVRRSDGAAAPAQAAVPGEPAAQAVPAELPQVVARVNGQDVQRSELDMAVKAVEDRAGSAVSPEQRDALYRQVLDRLVGYHLLVQEARRRKIAAPAADVDDQIADMRRQFPNEAAFSDLLQSRGVTLEQLRADTADTLAVNRMLQSEIEPGLAVTEAEARAFFEQNQARFRQGDAVRASHILVRVEAGADAAVKAQARARAERLLAELKQGAAFSDLAKRESQDPGSAANGGDLGFLTRGDMVPAFAQSAFSLKPGQTSSVVETPLGFHIISVTAMKPGRDLGFDDVKARVEGYLKQQARDRKSQEFVEQLKAKGRIEILM